ncbi:unnamed protein product [Moneuplotes crassus]|uniref:Uncharacterized protein n=1 Tax=Euplotes crassus TaxID=5936 RepID=A0AAD1XPW8_EUPCR|nr:unnamed protein product [Moneuplotes crassus]
MMPKFSYSKVYYLRFGYLKFCLTFFFLQLRILCFYQLVRANVINYRHLVKVIMHFWCFILLSHFNTLSKTHRRSECILIRCTLFLILFQLGSKTLISLLGLPHIFLDALQSFC